ncbi:aminoglycoside phosphotransferase family protein [Anaerolinea sp.]|uniref:phosphotransferase family protein n=1 Tax=Anaerolinea sp. TaxID=1872519 RepID=UPI002ACDFC52|nr:aminoglycoside phosphotransferase family protein [Anaerolinea sp.]
MDVPDTPLAVGRTAEIFAWRENQVLKLFHAWVGFDAVEYEYRIARAVQSCGLPVPQVGEIVEYKERYGITCQRIKGISMTESLVRTPWKIFRYARRMAELHARVHAVAHPADIPPLHPKIARKILQATSLPARLRQKALNRLEQLPDGHGLCHGDFHPDNILLTPQGEVILDWMDAGMGNPLADLARTSIILKGSIESGQIRHPLLKRLARLFHRAYLARYFSLRPGGESEYALWLPVIAAARLSEHIPELEGWLVTQAEQGLSQPLPV